MTEQRWEIHERADETAEVTADVLVLDFDARQKCRLLARTQAGREVGIFLARGDSLQHGDLLKTTCGEVIRVDAAEETLSEVICDDAWTLARAAYHLGNRHVPLQVMPDRLRFQSDYVLDDMIRQMGLQVSTIKAGFQPEKGAYHGHSHTAHSSQSNVFRQAPLTLVKD